MTHQRPSTAHVQGMTPYDVLGVSRTASPRAIKFAYRARMRYAHPDNGGRPGEAQKLNEAFAVLSDPVRRAAIAPERPTNRTAPPAGAPRPTSRARGGRRVPEAKARREFVQNTATGAPAAKVAPQPTPKAPMLTEAYTRPAAPIRHVSVQVGIAIAVLLGALNTGLPGAVFPLTAILLLNVAWNRWTVLAVFLYPAVPALIPLAVTGVFTLTDALHMAGATAGVSVMLALWAHARTRNRTAWQRGADIFRKTRDENSLPMHVVLGETVSAEGQRTLRVQTIGGAAWTMTPNADAPRAKRGDVILAHAGQPLLVLGEDERRYL